MLEQLTRIADALEGVEALLREQAASKPAPKVPSYVDSTDYDPDPLVLGSLLPGLPDTRIAAVKELRHRYLTKTGRPLSLRIAVDNVDEWHRRG